MPFLFIPGTGGVNFTNVEGDRASFVLEILHGRFGGWTDAIVRELSCEHPRERREPWPPDRTSLSDDGARLEPREVLLATAYPAVSRGRYEMFPYDWRLDIRYNAIRLLDHVRSQEEPTNLLTHSQGGLVAVAASLLCDDAAEWHERVSSVCMVAPPLVGTVNAMDAMISGTNFASVNTAFFRAASRTWPALFQMFPQWACVANRPAKRSTSASLWPDEAAAFQDLLERAKEYFAWIDYAPLRHMRPERVMVVLGKHPVPNTARAVDWTPDGPLVNPERVAGDTLVPYDATFAMLADAGFRNRIMTVKSRHQPAHFRLLGDARIYSDCDRFLSL